MMLKEWSYMYASTYKISVVLKYIIVENLAPKYTYGMKESGHLALWLVR